MTATDTNIPDAAPAPVRLAKVETNIRWIAFIAALVIAAQGWLNIQTYEQGERLAIIETRLNNLETTQAEMKATIDGIEARLDGIEARMASIEATMNRIEAHLSE